MGSSGGGDSLSDFFDDSSKFGETTHLSGVASPEDIFSILERLEGTLEEFPSVVETGMRLVSQKSTSSSAFQESDHEGIEVEGAEEACSPKSKRQKLNIMVSCSDQELGNNQQMRMSHITVERNRRKQMNEHLSILRSLMPCFYVKRGDQASIIGGVVNYINELQQVLQSLEAKKQRKVYTEILSPRLNIIPSSRPSPAAILSPRKPPLSPRLISPRTPQPTSPYKPRPLRTNSLEPSPSSSSTNSSIDNANELVANSKSAIADVEVKFSGPNVLLKTVSPRIPGQAMKITSALEDLSLEILHVSITTIDETLLSSFTIKIGIECQLSAEDLAHQIQQTFC